VDLDDDDGGFLPIIHRSQAVTYGLQEMEVVNLTKRFLSLVHTKNLILDDNTQRRYANTISENGFSWDGPSSLVVNSFPKFLQLF
jgi:hypothetical protein